MADERSVDVDEPTNPPPPTERPRVTCAGSRLSPVQEAWGAYVRHATRCSACRDVDQRCTEGAALYQAWRELTDAAFAEIGKRRP
ncbi:hypothetical protein ACH49_16730 [Streptomyces leeuwenhoekii]|uniref:4Fe-4S Wbl-type domain-containing protein n=1 Tax=Streptomyces leeuwenhoekii TaxID=1437453 RepID=A0ABR5HX48_STRLW|nr:hypothetical protein ACH49_16730 [Streptomyces leeuwenhoekii]